MKCIKCTTININKANYCKNCGYKFNDDERKVAKKHTLVGKLEILENTYNMMSLKVITDHVLFKIFSLVVVILMGLYFVFYNGKEIKFLKSDNYSIEYNTQSKEYYLIVKEDSVRLNLFVPNKVKKLAINHYDVNNSLISELDYFNNKNLVLKANYNEDYYVLSSDNVDIKFFVYRTEVEV